MWSGGWELAVVVVLRMRIKIRATVAKIIIHKNRYGSNGMIAVLTIVVGLGCMLLLFRYHECSVVKSLKPGAYIVLS